MSAYHRATLLVAVLALSLLAPDAALCAKPPRESVATMAAKISSELGDLSALQEFLEFKEFSRIYDDPAPSLPETLEFLASASPSDDQKVVAVYAMQKLPFEDYLTFVNKSLRLLNDGKISARVFQNGAFPTLDWNTTLAENFNHAKVRAFLADVKRSPKAKKLRPYVGRVLSGQAAKDVAEMRRKGEIPK